VGKKAEGTPGARKSAPAQTDGKKAEKPLPHTFPDGGGSDPQRTTPPNAKNPPGAALMGSLWATMKAREEVPVELARQLGITYAYLMALARGERPINAVSREILVAAANYLRIPAAQAFLLAEALHPEDFAYSAEIEEKLDRVRETMAADVIWMGYTPSRKEWHELPVRARMLIALLYERAGQTKFFSEDPE
jgi:transcriptional regulator with XRE-family HTH domain